MTTRSRTVTWEGPAALTSRISAMSGLERVQALLDAAFQHGWEYDRLRERPDTYGNWPACTAATLL